MGETRLLDGLRVVDLTEGYGALAARLLMELGADVVRVELDGARDRWPRTPGGQSLHHLVRNAGKPILDARTVDLDALLVGADLVVISSDTPESLAEVTALHDRYPSMIVVVISPFGIEGPCAHWQGTELVTQCLGGLVYRSGVPELPPVAAPGHHSEDMGAVQAVLAGLLAIRQRRIDGEGRVVDVSAALSQSQATDMSLPLWSKLHMVQVRSGAGAYPMFECIDGTVRIVLPMSPKEWRDLVTWLGPRPEWSGGGWDEPMLGPDERDILVAALVERCAGSTVAAIEESAGAANVRIAAVLSPAQLLHSEHARERATFVDVDTIDGPASVFAGTFSIDGRRSAIDPFDWPVSTSSIPTWPIREIGPDGSERDLPLEGLRVIEIGTGVAAPEGARLFADWGADVIKIEHASRPDFQRTVMGGTMNPAFVTVARNKRVFGVDLSTDEGRDLLLRLVAHADVLVENNATGVLDRLGIGWDRLRAANPALVLVDTQLYGDRGPWSQRKGYGPIARAAGGLAWFWAHGPDAPRGVMSIHPDHLGGRLVAIAALAGLESRDRDGVGHRIDIAQFEAVCGLLAEMLAAESLVPGSAVPHGNIHPDHAPWGLYRCADDDDGSESWLAVCVRSDDDWQAVLTIAGEAFDAQASWDTVAGRLVDRSEVDAAVSAWLATRSAAEVETDLQGVGVPAGRALHPAILVDHPLYVGRGFCVEVDQPGYGALLLEGPAFASAGMGPARVGPAPEPAQHTEQIARDLLGLDPEEIRSLQGIGVLDRAETDE